LISAGGCAARDAVVGGVPRLALALALANSINDEIT